MSDEHRPDDETAEGLSARVHDIRQNSEDHDQKRADHARALEDEQRLELVDDIPHETETRTRVNRGPSPARSTPAPGQTEVPPEPPVTVLDVHESDPKPSGPPSPYDDVWRLAQRIAGTDFVPAGMRGNPDQVLAAILYGRELGLPEMMSLQAVSVIQGRPTLSAAAQAALVRKAGHSIAVLTQTDDLIELEGTRTDGTTMVVTWTTADAQRAGLSGGAWDQYPRQMLHNRATTELVRALFSDVTLGAAYDADEIQ